MSDSSQPQPDSTERRADAAHLGSERPLSARLEFDEPAVQRPPGRAHEPAVERLELLDDLVFEAIAGKPGALEQLQLRWPQTLAELGHEMVDESRSQYLRHAISVWQDCIEAEQMSNPRLAVAAIGVISILLKDN
jgi:hypothetical protein